jgi:hypothetical protein
MEELRSPHFLIKRWVFFILGPAERYKTMTMDQIKRNLAAILRADAKNIDLLRDNLKSSVSSNGIGEG